LGCKAATEFQIPQGTELSFAANDYQQFAKQAVDAWRDD
jgi:hypothetical protein